MKYPIFFIVLFIYFSYWIFELEDILKYFFIWPMVCSAILFLVYLINLPEIIIGKKQGGSYSTLLIIINLPWLILTYLVWHIQRLFSKEDAISKIGHSNISISRRLLSEEIPEGYDFIIDLTAEFIEDKKPGQNYFHLPWLDGVAPHDFKVPEGLTKDSKVLIHCAQGHGRSATYASILLARLGICYSPEQAYELILASRPHAIVSKPQLEYLKNYS